MNYKNRACDECEKRINVNCWAWMTKDEIDPAMYDMYEFVFIDTANRNICPRREIINININMLKERGLK